MNCNAESTVNQIYLVKWDSKCTIIIIYCTLQLLITESKDWSYLKILSKFKMHYL